VDAHVYSLPDWDHVGAFPLPRQPQGEALTAVRGGQSVLAGTEGSPTRIDLVDVPRRLTAPLQQADPAAASSAAGPDGSDESGGVGLGVLFGLGAGTVVLAGAVLLVAARRRGG
jgi:hypothetical protein